MSKKINVKGTEIILFQENEQDYISLTSMAKRKNSESPDDVIKNWLRNKSTIEFLGLWEQINNPDFKPVEFDGFKNEAGGNSFTLSPKRWIEGVNAIGLISRSGRNGGTFAHKDLAFEFASWISAEFKLFLIKEFQRLKEEENERLALGWDMRRALAKINYKVHTDAIKAHIIPKITEAEAKFTYANEADVLNKALFGLTAKEWRKQNSEKEGNMRDYADVNQLVCLSNLESFNAEFIHLNIPQGKRLIMLNEIAIRQMQSLLGNQTTHKLIG